MEPCPRPQPITLRNVFVLLLAVFLLVAGFILCRYLTSPPVAMTQIPTVSVETPFPTAAPATIIAPTLPSAAATSPPLAPVANVEAPVENSEWYIDGWAEGAVVVNVYGREMRFDLAEFRNSQTNAAIVVQCIDPEAGRPNLDFTLPVEQRDRFVYRGNLFWHTADPSMQRFIFVRHGELQ